MIANLAWATTQQIINNVLQTTLADKAGDNPYLKAALQPLIDTFLNGILSGLSPEGMAQSLKNAPHPMADASPTEMTQFMEQATLLQDASLSNA